jgi:hypothetical protein
MDREKIVASLLKEAAHHREMATRMEKVASILRGDTPVKRKYTKRKAIDRKRRWRGTSVIA